MVNTASPSVFASLRRPGTKRAILYYVMSTLVGFVMIYPILWLFSSSLKGPDEIWTNMSSLIPHQIAWNNYVEGWRGFGGIDFSVFFRNTFFYASVGTIAAVGASTLVAFGFSRVKFAGRSFWFVCMILTLMLPSQVQIIPQYIFFSKIGWINSYLPLIVPRFGGGAFFIFMIMQFIRGIPTELDEAAEIDGCNKFQTFFQIILPLIQPAIITAAIFSFYWTWEDFLTPVIYLNDPRMYTVSLALRSFADPNSATNWGAIFAMSSLSLFPVFLVFIFFQRYLVEGISTTGLKG